MDNITRLTSLARTHTFLAHLSPWKRHHAIAFHHPSRYVSQR